MLRWHRNLPRQNHRANETKHRVTLALQSVSIAGILLAQHIPDTWEVGFASTVQNRNSLKASIEPQMTVFFICLAIVGLTAFSVFSRSLFLVAGTRIDIPPKVHRALRYAPAAALISVIAPQVLTLNNAVSLASLEPMHNHKLLASIAAGTVFFYMRKMLLMIVVGMLALTMLRLQVSK